MNACIELQKLAVGYDGQPVVTDIDLSLPKGQILSIIGPNGSGKSTLLKTITRQLEAVDGVIRIGGTPLDTIPRRALSQQVAVMLTERPRPELMTCGDVVAAGRYPYTGRLGILSARDRERIDEALRLVNALAWKDQSFARISDGQRQRILLARAICQEPDILVLDEPTSFLDIRYAIEILDILRQLAAVGGVTVMMSLHELPYAKRVSDLVLCVKDGRVLYLDTPEAVFEETKISRLYDLPEGLYSQLFGGL